MMASDDVAMWWWKKIKFDEWKSEGNPLDYFNSYENLVLHTVKLNGNIN